MSIEIQAALWGAFIGGSLSLVAAYFIELKKDRQKQKIAITLFKFLNTELIRIKNIAHFKNVQKNESSSLIKIAEEIRQLILESSCEKIIVIFVKYLSSLRELDERIQAGNLGSAGSSESQLTELYSSFEDYLATKAFF